MKRILVFLLTTAAFASCGSTIGQQMTYNCCPNNSMQFFACPDQDSFDQCYNTQDASRCTRDPSRDIGCPALWPGGPTDKHR